VRVALAVCQPPVIVPQQIVADDAVTVEQIRADVFDRDRLLARRASGLPPRPSGVAGSRNSNGEGALVTESGLQPFK